MIVDTPPRNRPRSMAVAFAVTAVLVPVAATSLMLWSFLGRSNELSAVPVAIVNDDQAVTVGTGDSAKTIAAGRQLAASLTDPEVQGRYALDWILTDARDASDGLAAGRYHAVLTIPEAFSAAVTSTSGDAPVQADISVKSNASADPITGTIADEVAAAAADGLGDQASASYLDNLFVGFNTISQQMGSAASSASDLSSGASQLASSSVSVDQGAQSLSENLQTLDGGASSVAAGAAALSAGSAGLAGAAARTSDGAASIASASADLAGGMADAAAAGRRLADSAGAISTSAATIADACPDVAGPAYCARVRELAIRTRAHASAASGLADIEQNLATGAAQVATGSSDVAAGAEGLSEGSADVSQNAASLDAGAASVSNGAHSAADGASQLSTGTPELVNGANSVASGSQSLATSLASGAQSVPTYSDAQRQTLQTVITDPVVVDSQRVAIGGVPAWPVSLVAAAVLWLGAIGATYLRRRPLISSVAIPAGSPVQHAVSAMSTVGVAAAVQALAVWATTMCFGVSIAVGAAAATLTLVAATTFTVITIALRAVWRRQGVLIAILLFAAQLLFAGGILPIQTAPAFFQALNPVLPFTAFANALAGVVAGTATTTSVAASVSVLLGWAVIAAAMAIVCERRRSVQQPAGAAFRALPSSSSPHPAIGSV